MLKRESNVPLQADAHPLRSPSPAAERMRRSRKRRRDGLRCLSIELRETEVGVLAQKGFLKEDARNDRHVLALVPPIGTSGGGLGTAGGAKKSHVATLLLPAVEDHEILATAAIPRHCARRAGALPTSRVSSTGRQRLAQLRADVALAALVPAGFSEPGTRVTQRQARNRALDLDAMRHLQSLLARLSTLSAYRPPDLRDRRKMCLPALRQVTACFAA